MTTKIYNKLAVRVFSYLLPLTSYLFTVSCANDDNPSTPQQDYSQLIGEWYYEVAEEGECYDIRQGDELVETTYDHIGILVSLDKGFGFWTHYYLKDGEMVEYDGRYDASFDYQVDQKSYLHFVSSAADDEDRSTPLDGFGLHYDAATDMILSDPINGVVMTFRRVTNHQQSVLDAWNTVIDSGHVGLDESDLSTDIDPSHATEPSRVRLR